MRGIEMQQTQQTPTSANCSTTAETAADDPRSRVGLTPPGSTIQSNCKRGRNVGTATTVTLQTQSFLLPGRDEVVRRVWHCEQDGQYVTQFFDIWQAELDGHFAYRLYEAESLKSIAHSRHSMQADDLHLLVKMDLVPATASVPFIVRTGPQVDRAERWSAIK
jgi:hypothetical protein